MMAICRVPACDEHYACRLRAKNVDIAPSATPTRMSNRPVVLPRKVPGPSWEKGIAGETRSDGSFMPYLTESGSRMHVKEAGERRREIKAIRDRHRNDPHVFAAAN